MVDTLPRFRGEQFVNFKTETLGDLFQGEQTGILLYSKLIELIELIVYSASFGGLFLRPSARQAQFSYSCTESG